MTEFPMDIDPALGLLLCLLFFGIFWLGKHTGSMAAHERQRRLAKLRGRLNSIDPGEVTNALLDKLEEALPTEKEKA